MKLSTRARYGIHAMYDLAQNYGAQPRPIKAVAEAQTIPEAYLEQLLCTLRRAGLEGEDACGKSCDCPSRKVWKRLRDGLNEIVDGITLEDMLRRDE